MPATASAVEIAEAYFVAYNAGDLATMGMIFSDDARFLFNRSAIELEGKADVLAFFGQIREQFPDRHFEPGQTKVVSDDHVVIDHTWTGTAAVDVPEMGTAKGDIVRQEIVTVLTLSGGQIVEYHDYNYG